MSDLKIAGPWNKRGKGYFVRVDSKGEIIGSISHNNNIFVKVNGFPFKMTALLDSSVFFLQDKTMSSALKRVDMYLEEHGYTLINNWPEFDKYMVLV